MSIESEVAALTVATTALLTAVNTPKATLDATVTTATTQAALATTQVALAAAQANAASAAATAASASALSAGSALQQDLSAISAALHRSPNAITAMFLYDTSKDSDGGLWTERCQHTSWYNETLCGKWLGPHTSEAFARNSGAVFGAELVANGSNFTALTGWSANGTQSVAGGNLRITNDIADFRSTGASCATVIGQLYVVSVTRAGGTSPVGGLCVGSTAAANEYAALALDVYTSKSVTFIATTTTAYFRVYSGNSVIGNYSDYSNISVKQVTAQTATTSDYYQLSSDGKFYSLSKNLLTTTATLATQTQWLTAGTYTLSGTTGSTGSVVLSGAATGTFTAPTALTFTVATSGNVVFTVTGSVLTAQCELAAAATTYSANASTVRAAETFRGNKRAFPKLAAIVAEASSVTIYDLTEAGRPMWMRFSVTAVAGAHGPWLSDSGEAVGSAAAREGKLVIGKSSDRGVAIVDFAKDIYDSYRVNADAHSRSNKTISPVNAASVWSIFSPITIINNYVNAVAMTVLPDAPIDPITGLAVPTIAVATQGGLSVIKHNGTVINGANGSMGTVARVVFNSKGLWATRNAAIGMAYFYSNALIASTANGGTMVATYSLSGGAPVRDGGAYLPAPTSKNVLGLAGTSGAVEFTQIRHNTTAVAGVAQVGSQATIAPAYNAGFMAGDIRRAYLSDIGAGSVTASGELVTNGTFDTDTTGWTATNGAIAFSSGAIQVTGPGAATVMTGGAYQVVTGLVIGRTYTATCRAVSNPGGYRYFGIGTNDRNITLVSMYAAQLVLGVTAQVNFVATATSHYVSALTYEADTAVFDNISVKLVEPDRSYKAKGATLYGTLTKTEVAAASQLIAYSGFSASNYLQEPYSADLDFGVGELSVSGWVNTSGRKNLLTYTEDFAVAGWARVLSGVASAPVVTSNFALAPDATNTATRVQFNLNGGVLATDWSGLACGLNTEAGFTKTLGLWLKSNSGASTTIQIITENDAPTAITITTEWAFYAVPRTASGTYATTGGLRARGTFTANAPDLLVWHPQYEVGAVATTYQAVITGAELFFPFVSRAFSSGPRITFGLEGTGKLQATLYDGTTTRIVTTTAAYNTATWLKAEACYRAGRLAICVNGVEVASTVGAPLLTLNNASAVLTIGNSYALDAPFPGSIALVKLGATVPTVEQELWMYEQEKHMFTAGAQVCLPDATAIVDLTYDDATDKWIAISATNESEWSGLVRTSTKASPAGTYSKTTATSGAKLYARATTLPGVDIEMPAYGLREQVLKRKRRQDIAVFDYLGGFTATTSITAGVSFSLTSVASSLYPTSYVGAVITGSGIPASTSITGVSSTTIYMDKLATIAASGVQISFTDFILPVGYETKTVYVDGVLKYEGSTRDYTRLFDGFKETIRFGTAPAYNAKVQIQTLRSAT